MTSSEWRKLRIDGLNNACKLNVVITGMVRDDSQKLQRQIPNIENLGKLFKEVVYVFYENDSQDDTQEQLLKWTARNNRVLSIHQTWNKPRQSGYSVQRALDNIAYRNICFEHINTISKQLHFDYVIILDPDLYKFNLSGILTTFGYHQQFDMMGAYSTYFSPKFQQYVYFDVWAHQDIGTIASNDRYRVTTALRYAEVSKYHPLIPVWSCFGGVGIYPIEVVNKCRYEYLPTFCEHPGLHNNMRNNGFGRIFINPSMRTIYKDKDKY